MNAATVERTTRLPVGQRLLVAGEEPPLGAHLVTPRRLYFHHGLYVGQGRVIHYGGLARGLHRGPVEEVSLEQFAHGRGIWIRTNTAPRFEREQVVARARSRLGERRYHVLTNNCEHFCEWCLHGESRSAQVDAWRTTLRSARDAVTTRFVTALRTSVRRIDAPSLASAAGD